MNTEISTSDVEYFEKLEKRKAYFKKQLEESPEMWERWTNSDKRYSLISLIDIVDLNKDDASGKVLGHLDLKVSSNNLDDLKLLWGCKFIQSRFHTPTQHFIIDNKDKKVIEFMSVCM